MKDYLQYVFDKNNEWKQIEVLEVDLFPAQPD